MKKISIILFSLVFTAFLSCEKEDIRPIQDQEHTPVLLPIAPSSNDDFNTPDQNGMAGRGPILTSTPSDTTTISDPNRDEDDNKKIKIRTGK